MTVIVTMAGSGTRFRHRGYEIPKHMICARGRTLFEWSMDSLKKFGDQHFVFACLEEHDLVWIERQAKSMGFSRVTVAPRTRLSLGQAETAYDVISKIDLNEVVWVYNIDTYIESGISPSDIFGYQGCVHVFSSMDPGMSFVRFDENNRVIELAEKKVISGWATVGIYGFEDANLYKQLYEASYQDGRIREIGGERYIAPMYQLLLNTGGAISAPKLNFSAVRILGTPDDVLAFDSSAKPPFGS